MISNDQIAKQAKKIMDDFIGALGKATLNDEFKVRREQNIRDSNAKDNTNSDFPERMLKNAPATKDNMVQAERKKW